MNVDDAIALTLVGETVLLDEVDVNMKMINIMGKRMRLVNLKTRKKVNGRMKMKIMTLMNEL